MKDEKNPRGNIFYAKEINPEKRWPIIYLN